MELDNKIALITGAGATGGIGGATARLFAREGASVVISGRDAARGEHVVSEITATGGAARFVLADLTDPVAVRRLAAEAGTVDILVNNAASIAFGATVDQQEGPFDESFAANVRAPFFLTAALAPRMLERGSGSIVNITTMVARIGMPGMAVYSATKAALESLTRTWAAEFGARGVRVNAVAPGPTRSAAVAGLMGEAAEELGRQTPLARLASTAEIAEVVLFLASERSSYVTGATVASDGGRTAI
jgi:NAD(P)-dependent dehydrogenase (short-subunit alcohol dehydrogenase family)